MSEWRKKPACLFCRGMDAEEHRKWIAPSPMVRRDAKSILHLLLSAKCRLLVCVGAMVRLIFTPGFSKLRALIKFTTCCGQKECCGVNQLWQLQQSSEVWGSKHAVVVQWSQLQTSRLLVPNSRRLHCFTFAVDGSALQWGTQHRIILSTHGIQSLVCSKSSHPPAALFMWDHQPLELAMVPVLFLAWARLSHHHLLIAVSPLASRGTLWNSWDVAKHANCMTFTMRLVASTLKFNNRCQMLFYLTERFLLVNHTMSTIVELFYHVQFGDHVVPWWSFGTQIEELKIRSLQYGPLIAPQGDNQFCWIVDNT